MSDRYEPVVDASSDAIAASILDWWALAGVDALVDESPRDWRAAPAARDLPRRSPMIEPPVAESPGPAPVLSPVAQPVAPAPSSPLAPPTDFAAFRDWWSSAPELPLAPPPVRRAAIEGPADAPLMILCDQPEDAGEAGLAVVAGTSAELLSRMMRAIGLDLDDLLRAPLLAVPSPTTRAGPDIDRLAAIHRHLVRIAQPKRLLVMGDLAARALLRQGLAEARGRVHHVEGVPAVVTFNLRHLLGHPGSKAQAWADLLLLPPID